MNDKKKHEDIPVSKEELYNHFKQLSECNIDLRAERDVFESNYNTLDGDDVLNCNFREDEILRCIKKLKNNKAHGVDNIMNKFIKKYK